MQVERVRVTVRGVVQGVGFRPFVYRLARELALRGWVQNTAQGVSIEAEGPTICLQKFVLRLERDRPPRAVIQSLEPVFLDPAGLAEFEIRTSLDQGATSALILPDIATCPDCLRELFDPADRRHRYPFTNCTNCGPRFSIIEALPYDRANTSMRRFAMCADCAREYRDPADRRFHAEPNACPHCGPHLALWGSDGAVLATHDGALRQAADALRGGRIVALKGVGGFQLLVDARNDAAVQRLRARKRRQGKPLAVMLPSLEAVRAVARVDDLEARLLVSAEAPIVLLDRADGAESLAPALAPGGRTLGIMLPYTPLHHLLMADLEFPVVATSGNLSEDPICTDEHEALARLREIADVFLVHNRPIVRHVDDSVAREMCGRELILRRARGYAPLPVRVPDAVPAVLAVGGHLKNTVALGLDHAVILSQHIGDLATGPADAAFRHAVTDLPHLYAVQPVAIACDAHPDYASTHFARRQAAPVIPVQHHYAHVLACMAENELDPPVLGVAWDGTGYGSDGTIWGGEFLLAQDGGFTRCAHLRPFCLPGGEAAVRNPCRTALGVLFALLGPDALDRHDLPPVQACSDHDRLILKQMLARGVQAPVTTSAGRLFDAVAAILGVRQHASFEGQAAMDLEGIAAAGVDDAYPVSGGPVIDWGPMIHAILDDRRPPARIAAVFHNTLVEAIVCVARDAGQTKVVLTGGCFQNRYLTERAVRRLREEGFHPYWHQRVPPNDGGIALGQVMAAARVLRETAAAGTGLNLVYANDSGRKER